MGRKGGGEEGRRGGKEEGRREEGEAKDEGGIVVREGGRKEGRVLAERRGMGGGMEKDREGGGRQLV